MENTQSKEIMQLRKEVSSLKEIVEKIAILLNKKLIMELNLEAQNIQDGEYLTEEEFMKKHKIKTLHSP